MKGAEMCFIPSKSCKQCMLLRLGRKAESSYASQPQLRVKRIIAPQAGTAAQASVHLCLAAQCCQFSVDNASLQLNCRNTHALTFVCARCR
eukprot:6187652-Pleurochrysis_carterae.AAC.1